MKTILSLLLTLIVVHSTEAKDDLTARPIPDDERARLDLDDVYQKRVVIGGFSIVGSKKVSDYALSEAGYLIRQMMGNRDDLLATLNANKTRLAIMASDADAKKPDPAPVPLMLEATKRDLVSAASERQILAIGPARW